MNKLLQLLFVTSLINAYPDIPDELTGEMLKEMPAEVLDEFLDELRETDEDSVTIDSFLADGKFKTHEGFLTIHQLNELFYYLNDLYRLSRHDHLLNQLEL